MTAVAAPPRSCRVLSSLLADCKVNATQKSEQVSERIKTGRPQENRYSDLIGPAISRVKKAKPSKVSLQPGYLPIYPGKGFTGGTLT